MRLLIVVLVLVAVVTVDQARFNGYYGLRFSHFVSRILYSML